MTHPLTNDICLELLLAHRHDDGIVTDMRAAADWQLKKITEQWEEVINSNKTDIQVIREFDKRLKAMRLQEDNS